MKEAAVKLVLVLSPFVPHISEEMWQKLGFEDSLYYEKWPEYDEAALVLDTVEIAVQINGKVRLKADVANGMSKDELAELMMADERVKELTAGKNVVKVVAVPGKLVNIVVK
jgi:leucyl-tRNA synthetase